MDFDLLEGPSETFPHVSPNALARLAATAFKRLSFTFTESHVKHLIAIVGDPASSENDALVASYMLENARIASRGTLPLCQDTGTAQVFAWKGEGIATGADDVEYLQKGAARAWKESPLRFSTAVPEGFFSERDPGDNSPALVALSTSPFPSRYSFLFCAKGGGSSNKTSLVQATKALLEPASFSSFLAKAIPSLGTAACPPYTIAVVVGGISPEQNLMVSKLASMGYFDQRLTGYDYRVMGSEPSRDEGLEAEVMAIARDSGLGAQFGGSALAIGARVLRLPRHGASCPVSVAVSCAAHRNLHAYIDETGVWLEKTVSDPLSVEGFAEAALVSSRAKGDPIKIDTTEGVEAARSKLADLPPGTQVLLSGPLVVARDAAHARWRALLKRGESLPPYATAYPIMYAGPAETPPGMPIGSFGPTTAGRMDEYAEELMSRACSLVTVAKGNRGKSWTEACARHGAVYLGTPGGIAALIAERHVTDAKVLDYPELGMEAVRLVTVRDMPAFVITNGRGRDFFDDV